MEQADALLTTLGKIFYYLIWLLFLPGIFMTFSLNSIANVLATVCYLLSLIPIVIVSLEALKISTITKPLITVLNNILSVIPNILVAGVLLTVGILIARVIDNIVTSLLTNTGIDKMSTEVYPTGNVTTNTLSKILGKVVAVIVRLFFIVESLDALQLKVFDTVGRAIINYLPNVLFTVIILGLGFFGGQFIGRTLTKASKNKWLGIIIQVIFGVFAVFMALDQLNLANSFVNIAFLFIIGGFLNGLWFRRSVICSRPIRKVRL